MSARDSNRTQLDSELLRTFLSVAKAGSLSGAAARLYRTQSAVSLQVQKLEAALGQRVFERHGRGVAMTAAGERLLPVARDVVEMLNQVATDLREAPDEQEIRLGIPEEYGDTILPSILATFTEAEPTARIFVRCSSSMEFPRALAAGELDLALHSPERVSKNDVIVHNERAVWTGSAFHNVENRRPLPVALFDKTCWWRERCLDLLRKSGLEYQVVCTSQSISGVRAAIAAGVAIGVLPESTLTDHIRALASAKLPQLGETHLALTGSPKRPRRLAEKLSAIISRTFQGK
ncbi:LysR substrate-binding domain-containing protein [Mesorhizobium sp. WSM3876]|uniref:LysR family transcriptional regulator n=1 Tax=Mesorhizobium sp. WSM3876 TaxID=422277 RepID=UPI000BB02622|nr:LysR substrate-binding domain-containing protein [Mesorhizobium sp. WSM3876]PBB84037.1 transcriptional regulator [Mesorhizobium sp. WSM3876]